MREKELRLALVCYGGVSLAIYMHGITKEIWKLLRGSAARHGEPVPGKSDTEAVYTELLDALAPHVDLRVLTDIVAGASAGGINGIMLAHAVAGGYDMEPLRDLWLAGADVERLLEPEGAARRFSKLWASPLVWWARRRGIGVDEVNEPSVRAEVRAKLSRLMRSRWFRPPFSGDAFTRMLYDALAAMEEGVRGSPLIPDSQPLDLYVTVTDYHGAPEHLRLHSPRDIVETEHRLVIAFHCAAGDAAGRSLGHRAELAFAARATASFPGAFPPARVGEVDAVVRDRREHWPERAEFLARVFPSREGNYDNVTLLDGSVLNNRPFGPAIEALRHRPAHREVDRRFVYIDPKPGSHGDVVPDPMTLPGWFPTVLRSLADIPREQPIRDNLAAIAALSARVRRLRFVVDGMTAPVDAAIEGAVGPRFFLFRLTPERLSDWRSRTHTVAAREAGFAFAAYAQLKLSHVVEGLALRMIALGGHTATMTEEVVRHAVWNEVRNRGFDAITAVTERNGAASDYVVFLRNFDLDYRIRRLRFLIRRLNELAAGLDTVTERRTVEGLKAALYVVLAPYLDRRRDGFHDAEVRAAAAAVAGDPSAALTALASAMDLKSLDTETDRRLAEVLGRSLPAPLRRAMLRAYLGFPFYDIAMLPLLEGDGIDEFDEILVDRISPDDATAIRAGGAAATLKGTQFNAFGAFFSRAYRENDYLWGRLHGADRLMDIVVSTLPPGIPFDVAPYKQRAFRAILVAEREYLTFIPELLDSLDREVG